MYESPINVITQGWQTTVENGIYKAIESYGINIDKEELLKVLQYDRNQYDKGYMDGIKYLAERFESKLNEIDFPKYAVIEKMLVICKQIMNDTVKEMVGEQK